MSGGETGVMKKTVCLVLLVLHAIVTILFYPVYDIMEFVRKRRLENE